MFLLLGWGQSGLKSSIQGEVSIRPALLLVVSSFASKKPGHSRNIPNPSLDRLDHQFLGGGGAFRQLNEYDRNQHQHDSHRLKWTH